MHRREPFLADQLFHCTTTPLPESYHATHALVFMLEGILTGWKQTAHYELIRHSFHAGSIKNKIMPQYVPVKKLALRSRALLPTWSLVIKDCGDPMALMLEGRSNKAMYSTILAPAGVCISFFSMHHLFRRI